MTKPSSTKTTHILPFGELSPAQFERLCLWLVTSEGYLRAEHLGEAGNEQGRDVIAYRPAQNGEQLWYFQCKRYKSVGATTLTDEVEKYNALTKTDSSKKPFGIVFVTNATLSAGARERVRKFCSRHGYKSEFWARTELDQLVKRHPEIVEEFFNLPSSGEGSQIEAKGVGNVIIQGDATGATIHIGDRGQYQPVPDPQPRQDRISIARLPVTRLELFGRDAELKLLDDAWSNPDINIVTFVAWGGVGKTALVNHWLKRHMAGDNYRGAERVYGWSFFSQGTSERAASADLFIDQALRWFGDGDPTAGSPWDKGERLAGYLRQTRTLLILDGLEPLQHPPGAYEGRLKDAAMQALLVELAAQQPGLCVISTRERIGDLVEFEDGTVVRHDLEQLSPQAGAEILRSLNVKGDEKELEQASKELGGHAFSLTLLGSYLDEVLNGDIRRRKEIENLFEDTRYGEKAQIMIAAYEKWLGEGMELSILRLLGLFDRPADRDSIAAIREPPAITGLTEPLQHFKAREWNQAVAKLRRIKLLSEGSPTEIGTLDGHPLLREHFKQQLKRDLRDSWREGNNRLYEHLKNSANEFPDTIEEMTPLYVAVSHGWAAGRQKEVFWDVYMPRINRGNQYFSTKMLGTYGAELAVLSGLFTTPWRQLESGLTDRVDGFVLHQAGYCLVALGRLQEAAEPMLAALQRRIAVEFWAGAAATASNLSELHLIIGDIPHALKFAYESVELADRANDEYSRTTKRSRLADALHHAGRTDEAFATFGEAEKIQKQDQSAYPLLFSLAGFQYCDLLISQGAIEEVKERARQTLDLAEKHGVLLAIALNKLSLGQASLIEAEHLGTGTIPQAAEFLERAVAGLRESGMMGYLPRGLLARAALHRFNGDGERAERDLSEVLRVANRSGMGLYLADYHLESARLRLAQGDKEKARDHTATAKEMIERMGYHRRDNEVKELEEQLTS